MPNPIVEPASAAARVVFQDMFGIEARAGAIHESTQTSAHAWELSGLIGLAGQAQGLVAVRLPLELAESMLARSGVESANEKEKREMLGHLIAELTNIVAGHASSAVAGLDIDIAPPVVVRGPNHQISWPGIAPVIVVPFETDFGPFELVVCLKI